MAFSRSITRSLLAIGAALLMAAAPRELSAQAQATTGVIRGLVTDESNAPVAGAQVTLRNQETNVTRTVRTSDRGIYAAPLLPLGRYEVSIRAIGFAAVARRDLVLRVGQALDIPFRVSRQAVELAAVKVSDRATTPVNTSRSDATTTFAEEVVRGIPNNGRNFLALTLLTPNVATTQGPDGDVISVAGQRGTYNNVSVDGADFNNPFFGEQRGGQRPAFTFNLDAVQELVVTNAGANAEFGRSAGGFVNVITKSGTNTLQGYGALLRQERRAFRQPEGQRRHPDPDFTQNQFGFTLGGPLVKDRAVLLHGVRPAGLQRDEADRPVRAAAAFDSLTTFLRRRSAARCANDFRPIDRTNDGQVFLLKLDYRVNETNNFSLKYNFTNSRAGERHLRCGHWGRQLQRDRAGFLERDQRSADLAALEHASRTSSASSSRARIGRATTTRRRCPAAGDFPGHRDGFRQRLPPRAAVLHSGRLQRHAHPAARTTYLRRAATTCSRWVRRSTR